MYSVAKLLSLMQDIYFLEHSMKKLTITLSLLAILLTACGGLVGRSTRGGESEANGGTPVAATKQLGAFYPIDGTHYQLASISAGSIRRPSRPMRSFLFIRLPNG